MKRIAAALLLILMLCGSLLGQSSAPVTQPQTFHIKGTISDPSEAVVPGVKVTFQGEQLSKAVTTNGVGVYEADLPLGDYTMTAQSLGFRPYRRPLFRVMAPASLIVDVTLPVAPTCDIVLVNSSGTPATPEEWAAARKDCLREDFFPLPSKDGVQYQLYVRYVGHAAVGDKNNYSGEKHPNEDPVFVAYNLFTLRADRVTYDSASRIIEASGNVLVVNESGASQRGDYASFKMEDGQAVRR